MRRFLPLLILALTMFPIAVANAQGSTDFMAGRLFQISLEAVPSFTASAEATFGTLETSATQSFEQTLTAGTCYAWLAVGNNGQNDLDLAVFVNNVQVAGDNAVDDWPIAQYCSATEASARIDLQMYSGSGQFGFQTYSRFFGGGDQIELQMNFLASLFAPGQVPQGALTRGSLAANGEQSYPMSLSAGQCYTMLATGGAGVVDLDLFLVDSAGQTISSDVAPDSAPVVGGCPTTNGNYTLRVLMYGGAGDFGWQSFAAPYQ